MCVLLEMKEMLSSKASTSGWPFRWNPHSPARVAKLKTCSWTYTDWLGLLLCQLLTRRRKLQPWPHIGARERHWEVILLTRTTRGTGRTRWRDEGTSVCLSVHCGWSSWGFLSSHWINIQVVKRLSWGMKRLESNRVGTLSPTLHGQLF